MKLRAPDFITFGNALCGLFAIFMAAHGDYYSAARLVALGMFLDALDGPLARSIGPTVLGKELDRSSDRITQVIAPATILVAASDFHPFAACVGALLLVASLIRLVRTWEDDSKIYGLPLNASALTVVAGTFLGIAPLTLAGIIFVFAILSFSTIPYSLVPLHIRKPKVEAGAGGVKTAMGFAYIALRGLPLLALAVLPAPYLTWLSVAVLAGIVLFAASNTAFGVMRRITPTHLS